MTGAELRAFGDATERGYGACMYLRLPQPDDKYSISFVMSRGRVAPVKCNTALSRADCSGFVCKAGNIC